MKRWLARALLRTLGWKIEGEKPLHRKYVLIAAPHTSNWDFPMMMLFAWSFDIRISWMGKDSLFKAPLGWIMRRLGGVPVARQHKGHLVQAMVETFAERDDLVLVVPTEGTRARTEYWKSGFYHIARGDVKRDMALLRGFYAPMKGLYPENFSPVRLREEDNDPETGRLADSA